MRLIWIDYLAASWKRRVIGSRRTTRKQECKKEWRVLFVPASARTSSTPIVSQICRRTRWGRRCRLSASWSPPKIFGSDQWRLDISESRIVLEFHLEYLALFLTHLQPASSSCPPFSRMGHPLPLLLSMLSCLSIICNIRWDIVSLEMQHPLHYNTK